MEAMIMAGMEEDTAEMIMAGMEVMEEMMVGTEVMAEVMEVDLTFTQFPVDSLIICRMAEVAEEAEDIMVGTQIMDMAAAVALTHLPTLFQHLTASHKAVMIMDMAEEISVGTDKTLDMAVDTHREEEEEVMLTQFQALMALQLLVDMDKTLEVMEEILVGTDKTLEVIKISEVTAAEVNKISDHMEEISEDKAVGTDFLALMAHHRMAEEISAGMGKTLAATAAEDINKTLEVTAAAAVAIFLALMAHQVTAGKRRAAAVTLAAWTRIQASTATALANHQDTGAAVAVAMAIILTKSSISNLVLKLE